MKQAYILPLLAAVVLILLFLYAWNLRGKLDSANSALTEKEALINYFKSESGKTVAEKPAAEISKADLQEHYADLAADLKDMKIKLSQVKALFKAVVESKGEGVVLVVRDTIIIPGLIPVIQDSVLIDDSYLRLSGRLSNSEFRYKYSYSDSIVMAISSKKKWLFGKERLYGSARMSNPNSRATNTTSVLIKPRDKRFVISAGVSYSPFSGQFQPSVNFGYALIRF